MAQHIFKTNPQKYYSIIKQTNSFRNKKHCTSIYHRKTLSSKNLNGNEIKGSLDKYLLLLQCIHAITKSLTFKTPASTNTSQTIASYAVIMFLQFTSSSALFCFKTAICHRLFSRYVFALVRPPVVNFWEAYRQLLHTASEQE